VTGGNLCFNLVLDDPWYLSDEVTGGDYGREILIAVNAVSSQRTMLPGQSMS